MKDVVIYLAMLLFSVSGLCQEKTDTVTYTGDDIVLRVLDTLYVPSDTSLMTIPYDIVNNSPKLIQFGDDKDREVFVPNKGWEPIDFKQELDSLKRLESLTYFFKRIEPIPLTFVYAILRGLRPGERCEGKVLIQEQDRLIYQPRKRYRIVKYFNFEGEENKKYYVWDELVVKGDKEKR